MPYVKCRRCGLKTFSASQRSNAEYCASCGARFARSRREAVLLGRYRRRGALLTREPAERRPRSARADEGRSVIRGPGVGAALRSLLRRAPGPEASASPPLPEHPLDVERAVRDRLYGSASSAALVAGPRKEGPAPGSPRRGARGPAQDRQ